MKHESVALGGRSTMIIQVGGEDEVNLFLAQHLSICDLDARSGFGRAPCHTVAATSRDSMFKKHGVNRLVTLKISYTARYSGIAVELFKLGDALGG